MPAKMMRTLDSNELKEDWEKVSIQQFIFYGFALLVVGSGLMMILSRNPVKSALFLVVAFFGSAALWMMLEAEFLSLILIFVYVGAVMTLFLFVVMMIHLEPENLKGGFVRYLPVAVIISALMVGIMVYVIDPAHITTNDVVVRGIDYSNIKELGSVLYTDYVYPFELAAILLLVAIIAAITLSHRRREERIKGQDIDTQLSANSADRLRIVDMPSEARVRDE